MKLTAKVVETISGADRDDRQPRVKLKVAEADSCFRTFIVPNSDGLALDDEVVVLVMTKDESLTLWNDLANAEHADERIFKSYQVLDQLRPDSPPQEPEPDTYEARTAGAKFEDNVRVDAPPDESTLKQAMKSTEHLDDETQEFVREGA